MIHGGCFCGDIRFELGGEPTFACHCHCLSCQQASGAPFVTWVTFAADALKVTHGAISVHHSSPGVTRGHCCRCGTSVTYAHANRPDEIDITGACIEEQSIVRPKAHIWLEDKAPWVVIDDDLPQYQQRVT